MQNTSEPDSTSTRTHVSAASWARRVLLTPWYLLALATKSKSFASNPLLGSRLLNRLGLHVVRVVLADGMTRWRWWLLQHKVDAAHRQAFQRDGFIVIEDFLPAEMFAALEREARGFNGPGIEQAQGDTLTQHVFLDAEGLAALPAARNVVDYPLLRKLLQYTGSYNAMPHMFLQRIVHAGRDDEEPDPQKNLHKDTFHPTMKAWLFIDDVGPDRGPFTYARGSHRLTRPRLQWEYRQSLSAAGSVDPHHAAGSFRADSRDLAAMGYREPESLAVRKNTLVIANTVGFHCRGAAVGATSRLELWAFSRRNPFLPWPGIDSGALTALSERVRRGVRRGLESRSLKAGQEPEWRSRQLDFRAPDRSR